MDFRILGALDVLVDGGSVAPRRPKRRALLAALLLGRGQVVPREVLVEALWSGEPPQTAQTALHGHVSALRKALGDDRIATEAAGYRLRVERDELDADRFERLAEEARAVADPTVRASSLAAALALWRGEPLADFRYDAFAQPEIRRLHERRLAALEDRIDADLEAGRHRELLPELEAVVAAEPLRERPRAQFMLALYRSGRQREALDVFQEGRRILAEEFGLEPGPALRELERQILTHDAAVEPPRPAAPLRRQERKEVVVLVVEFSGPSDPEELDKLVKPALDGARDTLVGFGASVEGVFANALIGIFGAPRAHEDDPERAVRAAAALVEQASDLTVAIGVERGEALVTIDGDRVDVTGGVVAAASRLQATSAPGEVALGGLLRATLASAAEPVQIPFVGREPELALLERTYERSARESSVQLVTIAGEPGAGKTRLASELRGRLASTRWLAGRCLPFGDGVTFWALGEIVKLAAGILESDDADVSGAKLASALDLLVDGDDPRWLQASLAPLVGVPVSAGAGREQSFAAWRRFLELLAAHEPTVVLLEDIHWADTALLAFLDELTARAAGVPLLVVCTTRLDLLDRHPQWAGGKRNAITITLHPLSSEETSAIARAVLGGEPPAELVSRAGGNPLFAQELARSEPGGRLPQSLQGVIVARLDTLDPTVKQAAMDAAVVGEVFWAGAVATICDHDEQEVEERFHRLVSSDVIRRAPRSSVRGQTEYAFLHALVRDAAYNQIPKMERAQKHAAAATWIEQLAGDRVSDHAELIAHHYAAALAQDHSEALAAKTSRYLSLAADRAMQFDITAAARFYTEALAILPEHDRQRAHVLARLARTAQEAGRLEESERLYEEAVEALRQQSDAVALADTLVAFYIALSRRGKTSESRLVLAEAIDLLEAEPPGQELAFGYVQAAREHVMSAEAREALDWSERAITLAERLGLQHHVVRALQFRGSARCMLNDLGGLEDLHESLRLGLAVGAGIETAIAYTNLGDWLSATEGPAACLELYARGIDFSEARGFEHNAYVLRMNKLPELFDTGRWDELLGLVDEIVDWERDRGESWLTARALVEKGRVLILRGRIAEGLAAVDTFLPSAREVRHPQVLVPALLCAVLAEHARGNETAALNLLTELEPSPDDPGPTDRAHWVADLTRVAVELKSVDLAKRVLNENVVAPRHVHAVHSARAILAEADRKLNDALASHTETAARWRAFGNVVEEAYALLGRGRCLVKLDRAVEAEEPLAAARVIFASLDAHPLLADVDEQLRLAGLQ